MAKLLGLQYHRYSKNGKKVENLMSHFWEATQVVKVKFLLVTYVHLDYSQTEFRPNLRGSLRNLGELIWNYPLVTGLVSWQASQLRTIPSIW